MGFQAIFAFIAVWLFVVPAAAQRPDPGMVEADVWTELPTQLVSGRTDMAVANFSSRNGATTIRFRAVGGEIRLSRIELVYSDSSTRVLDVRHVLGAGELTGPIALPQATALLKEMRISVLSTSPLGENRRISAFASGGRAATEKRSAPVTPRGWIAVGLKRTSLGHQRETISLGRDRGRFAGLSLRVRDAPIMLRELRVTYANGETMTAALAKKVEPDQLTPPLRVSSEQTIHEVHVVYDTVPGLSSGRPLLELLGAYDPDYVGNDGSVIVTNGGWLLLGLQTSALFKRDSDYVLGSNIGVFNRLRFTARGGDAELRDVHLTLANGPPLILPVNQILLNGRASSLIELPKTADGERPLITSITLNRKGRSLLRGEIVVEIWGQY